MDIALEIVGVIIMAVVILLKVILPHMRRKDD